MIRIGSRRRVYNGTAQMTGGRLKKEDLIKNKWGRIVSKRKSIRAKKDKRLIKAGYKTIKGKFGSVKENKVKKGKKKTLKRQKK
tara:strand:+ start:1155 stop:1406 length:252 start_codon:yes stop_codon:yes gene_type:complete